MTREEAIKALEHADSYVGIHYINGVEEAYINPHLREAVKVALTALRPVSREQVKKKMDAAIDCIYKIEDDLDRGNDNDWAREHISEWKSQKED